jgi:hypothetical protein
MGGREEVKIGAGSVVDVAGEMRGEIGGVVWSVGRGPVWSCLVLSQRDRESCHFALSYDRKGLREDCLPMSLLLRAWAC